MYNPRVSSLDKSLTLKITALTKKLLKEGKDVVNFAAGEPDFDTPEPVKDAAIAAINSGFTKYTPSAGIPQLKEAIADKLTGDNGLKLSAENIIVTAGAKYALFTAIFTILTPGDEVIIPSPYWVSYPQIARLAGAKVNFLDCPESDNFKIDPSRLEKAITAKTKLLILNYPSNPTGVTYSSSELKAFYEVVRDKNIFVISDEIYESLVYDDLKHTSFASFPGAGDFTVTINGFSKAYSMTGWRVGYLAGPGGLIAQSAKIIDHTTSCVCSIAQHAAIEALKDKDWQKKACLQFQNRRNSLWEGLSGLEKIKPFKSQGTFYMFCDIRGTGLSSLEFSTRLLQEKLVSCIPANAFGKEGFVRLSFSTSAEQIKKGIIRIKEFING